jgi:RHS repeat-associated protein
VLNLRGSSQYFDAETGLHYNRHRYLDVESGRYLSADPSGQQGGLNLYAFAENNPVDNVDPLGLEAKPAGAVSTWSMQDKLMYLLPRVAKKFPGDVGNALLDMVKPQAIAKSGTGAVVDGASSSVGVPKSIEYDPPGSVVLQPKGSPLCGPTTCNMIINDAAGHVVDLNTVVGQFKNVRPTGVNMNEMSEVLSNNGVANTKTATLSVSQMNAALAAGKKL